MLRDLSRSACRRRARDAVDRNGCADIAAREPNAPVVGSGVPQSASAARISFIATCEGCSSQAIASSPAQRNSRKEASSAAMASRSVRAGLDARRESVAA